jgi:lysophospholipase L1-like esterase
MRREIDRRVRFRRIVLATSLVLLACGGADARKSASGPPPAVPPLDPALAAAPLDPNSRRHVYVITDSVMLGAKQKFIDALPDWQVTFDGRPAIQIRQALKEYTLSRRDTGPVAVVALGYNTLWEKDRHNFKRWSDMFDKHVEEMLAALKERGAKRIVWVMLRELTPDMISGSRVSVSQFNRYAWYFPYVNERLKAIKERHPEMALADWAVAGKANGVTYDLIHLNGRGAEMMTEVVKTAMGIYGEPSAPAPSVAAVVRAQAPVPVPPTPTAVPTVVAVAETPRTVPVRRVVLSVQSRAETAPPRVEPVQARVEPQPAEDTQAVQRRTRGHVSTMMAMSQVRSASVVMLGDSLTQRAPWNEITGCGFLANRGIGGDVSAGVLRRLDEVTKLGPSAVFLMIGINDIARKVPNETIVGNVRRIIERLNDAGAKVYLTLTLPVTRGYVPKMNPTVNELNTAFIALAKETKATVVDFRQEMRTDEGALRNDLTVDGIHLSPEGYRVWRDAITPLVARHCSPEGELVAQTMVPKRVTTTRVTAAAPPEAPVAAPAAAPPVAQSDPQPAVQRRPQVADMTASIPTRAIARGAWIIQVGAYPEEEKAQERIRQAQDLGKELLANADPFTEKVVKGSRELYRARFAGFNQSAAEAACSYFKRNAIDCISMKR